MQIQRFYKFKLILITIVSSLFLSGCTSQDAIDIVQYLLDVYVEVQSAEDEDTSYDAYNDIEQTLVNLEWDGEPYIEINGNQPFFTDEQKSMNYAYEHYEQLDELGRCQYVIACICEDTMPTGERESISSVTPTGWENNKYDFIDGGWLYNRCHLIGYQLTAENLITGTRYLNIRGMLPYENLVASYVKQTGNHVIYRVTPCFKDYNLLASGVLMEGYSVEDNGEEICFCIYCFNVQPGVKLYYETGYNEEDLYSE